MPVRVFFHWREVMQFHLIDFYFVVDVIVLLATKSTTVLEVIKPTMRLLVNGFGFYAPSSLGLRNWR